MPNWAEITREAFEMERLTLEGYGGARVSQDQHRSTESATQYTTWLLDSRAMLLLAEPDHGRPRHYKAVRRPKEHRDG